MKWYGKIGYVETKETSPGVWKEIVTEKDHYGDIIKNFRKISSGDGANDNVVIDNSLSILADPYSSNNYYAMRYATYLGTKWKITNIEVSYPRLNITLGGIYNENSSTAP